MKQNQTTQNPETPSIKGNQTLTSPIAIIGMALSGEASLRLLLNLGYSRSHIKTYDQKMMAHTDTTDINELIDFKPKTLIVSPGVPLSLPWIQKLLNQGATLLNEIDLAAPYLESEKVIGITGSIGKSTTAALVAEAANAWTPHVFLGGNFGDPLVNYISDVIEKKRPRADLLVIELSSYHLETLQNSIFDLSAITYFTANHLERYDSIDSYYKTKWKLTQLTKGI
jgi:UDP-N-acetylmuramoylalanine--D-glutamate ligase